MGRALLFFGCRHADDDFLYRDEWDVFQRQQPGVLDLVTAFSRVESGEGKAYVQQRVRESGQEVARLLLEERCILLRLWERVQGCGCEDGSVGGVSAVGEKERGGSGEVFEVIEDAEAVSGGRMVYLADSVKGECLVYR